MKCPQCKKEGKKSCVYVGMSMTTCMGVQSYYDEERVNYILRDLELYAPLQD
jgi:hypothetical protein